VGASVLHQDLPHQVGGNSKEVSAILPLWRTLSGQAKIGLVHEGRALQRVVAAFSLQIVMG
jgi:hypothetical protein